MTRPTSLFTRGWRLTRMGLHILRGFATLATVFPKATPKKRDQLIRSWGHHVLRIFAITLHVEKPHDFDPTAPRRLLIGNHISWLDIYALQAITAARFVAKSELAHWPVLGQLIARSGTVFIERGKRSDTKRINQTIMAHLAGFISSASRHRHGDLLVRRNPPSFWGEASGRAKEGQTLGQGRSLGRSVAIVLAVMVLISPIDRFGCGNRPTRLFAHR